MSPGRRRFGLLWLVSKRRSQSPTRATVLPGEALVQAPAERPDQASSARMVADLSPPIHRTPPLPRWRSEGDDADGAGDTPA